MKKAVSFFTAVLMLLTAFPLTVFAENSGEILYSVISEKEKTCKITGALSNAWELTQYALKREKKGLIHVENLAKDKNLPPHFTSDTIDPKQ